MTTAQILITILFVALGTIFTRFISFIIFPASRETPPYIAYLGKVLPSAVMGMLIIYCYKSLDFSAVSAWLPSVIAGIAVALLQLWKKNMFISICSGTALYMVLIRIM